MSEEQSGMNLTLILAGVSALILILALFLPVTQIGGDLGELCEQFAEDEDECSQTILDWNDEDETGDESTALPMVFTIVAIIALLGAIAVLQVPGMEGMARFAGILAIVGGICALISWIVLQGKLSDLNDDVGTDAYEFAITGWGLLLAAIASIAGGALDAKDNFM